MKSKPVQPGRLDPEKIRYIVVHCTATPEGRDVTVGDVDACHRARGFASIGYHYLIRLDGTIERGRLEDRIGAHCLGKNDCSIGVCYVGGVARDGCTPCDTRTAAQRAALVNLITALRRRYPRAEVRGHRDFAAKACPSFDATAEYRALGVMVLAGVALTSCSTHRDTSTVSTADIVTTRRAEVDLEALRRMSDSLVARMYKPKIEVDTTVRFVADSIVLSRAEHRVSATTAAARAVDTATISADVSLQAKTETTPPGSSLLSAVGTLAIAGLVCLILRKIMR